MTLLGIAPYINIGFKFLTKSLSQYLNFKCGEQEFKNPFLNGLQMGVATAASQDIFDIADDGSKFKDFSAFDISKKILMPMLFGFATTADDLMINKGLTSKHYLTDIMSAVGTTDILMKNPILHLVKQELSPKVSGIISAVLLGVKYLQEHCTRSKGYIETTRTLNTKISQAVKSLEYVSGGAVNMSSAVATQFLTDSGVDLIKDIVVERISNGKKNLKLQYNTQAMQVTGMLKILGGIVISSVFSQSASSAINLRNNAVISSPEALLKISSNDKHSNTLNDIDKISNDINLLSLNILMMNSLLCQVQALNAAFPLINLRSSLGEILQVSDTVEIQKQLSDLTSYMSKSKTSLVSNPRTVIERSGLEYFVQKSQDMQGKMVMLQEMLEEKASKASGAGMINIIDAIIAGLADGNIAAIIAIMNTGLGIKSLPQSEVFMPSLERLTELYKFLENAKNTSYVSYNSHNGKNLYLKNIDIDIAGVNKLDLDEMTLEAGKWYLLTGKSGCGKTTFMSTLRGLPNFADSIEIRGDAYYPKLSSDETPKIYMLTQTNNFPYGVSMIESLLYPMVNTEEEMQSYKPLVEELMLKMEGYARNSIPGQEYLNHGLLSRLDERINDITSETSGGQQKKMSIAGMIVRIMKETGMLNIYQQEVKHGKSHDAAMAQAKISVGSVLVLIDETFNGLDSGANGGTFATSSKGLVLKTLKESLPSQAIVVSVEHQPQIDQYDGRIHLNGDGTYTYNGNKAPVNIPSEIEAFDPLKAILGDITEL